MHKKFLSIVMTISFSLALVGVFATVMTPTVYAAEIFDVPKELCGPLPCPEGSTSLETSKNFVEQLAGSLKVVIGAVAVLFIIIAGVKLVASGGNEEEFTKQSTTIIWGIIGLFVIGLASEISDIFKVSNGSDILSNANEALQKTRIFNRVVEVVMTFLKYIIGSISVAFVIRSGLRMVTLGGNEDEVGKDKKSIMYGILGLAIILMADPIIKKVFFKVDTNAFPGLQAVRPGIDAGRLIQEIAGVTNVIAAITGPIALLALVGASLMYALAGGDEEKTAKAKKIIQWAIIGIVIIYGSFAIVSTFVARQFNG